MTPFINGMATDIALGLLILLACIALALVIFAARLLWWFATFAVPQFIAGCCEAAPQFRQAWAEGNRRAEGIRARREKDLAWMERHWATRWCARLNRRLLG